jgi:hypothetical protein
MTVDEVASSAPLDPATPIVYARLIVPDWKRLGLTRFDEGVCIGVAENVEPALAAVLMDPALCIWTTRVRPHKEKLAPRLIVEFGRFLGARKMSFTAIPEFGFSALAAPGAIDQEHDFGP